MNKRATTGASGHYTSLDGEQYFCIANSHLMADFFMSLVGAGDHWMFISSNGALTAGRQNADNALFPYSADDQISAARAGTGSITLVRIDEQIWEPFAPHDSGSDTIRRNLYKTPLGNKLIFEEINETLGLTFRYRWAFSQGFGFVRSCWLENTGDTNRSIELLDGLQNVLPHGIGSEFLMRFSNLANAYKRSELVPGSDLGIFYLSSIPTDRAEPSEGLMATTVWQTGLSPDAILLDPIQISKFRDGNEVATKRDVRGKQGAYLLTQKIELATGQNANWQIVAELAQDHPAIIGLDHWLQTESEPAAQIDADIGKSEEEFLRILSSSDGIQMGNIRGLCSRHLSNTVFNLMRGGVPLDGYQVRSADFSLLVENFNSATLAANKRFIDGLPETLNLTQLQSTVAEQNDPDLTRLSLEYLPLAFSRRHGDPTRPWNHFSIDLESEGGEKNLNYQGNWRDLFQNWEALLVSFPEFSTGMICRFLNATTADGYNPYKVTRNGFDWESPNPNDPWANIGYWGDHQIIYLLKLLEWNQDFYPGALDQLLDEKVFTHANVPYRIKPFDQIRENSQDTIEFDFELAEHIEQRVEQIGADGKLLPDNAGGIHRVTLVEKILTLSLAKLSNFIPDGGIWLNTQRPEWNDANNALVGNGLSMVTTCYLRRWFDFLQKWIAGAEQESFNVSAHVATFFQRIAQVLEQPPSQLDAHSREQIVEALSLAGSDYRQALYSTGLAGETTSLSREDCVALFQNALRHIDATIKTNRRPDGLYHSYSLLDWSDYGIEIEPLYEMLEGQVAVLSSGLLSSDEAVQVLDALRSSKLYRENQQSYILYPDRRLPGFLEKNQLDASDIEANPLVKELLVAGDQSIIVSDIRGGFHFSGKFKNSADLHTAIKALPDQFSALANTHADQLIRAFEEHFGHRQFTGRSGTFFGYEGLGSIYWHMISKLGLAVSENYFRAVDSDASGETIASLKSHLDEIRSGIGALKSPTDYGAFPSDPYSHTPENAGVKQPGMTGQVKEDILARFAQLGVEIDNGRLRFRTELFDPNELLTESGRLEFFGIDGENAVIELPANSFGFTLFQVPIIYQPGSSDSLEVHFNDGSKAEFQSLELDEATSGKLFSRSGTIKKLSCHLVAIKQTH